MIGPLPAMPMGTTTGRGVRPLGAVEHLPQTVVSLCGGYYITGDWWKNNPDASFTGRGPGVAHPDNIWQFGTRLQYDFG